MADLTPQAETVATKRYYLKNKEGKTVENSSDMFMRVAETVANVELGYGKHTLESKMLSSEFFNMMNSLRFLPNSPTMMNAGTHQGTLSACFVLPLEDSMEGIMKAATDSAMVQKFGGGTGFALSKLRQKGAAIASTHGIACGPIEVLKTLSRVSSMITQGGKRDGANMAILDIHHPDIMEFISCKSVEGDIHNFNISVGVDDGFMQAVEAGTHYALIDPKTDTVVGELDARTVFSSIVEGAWRNGEPGMVFLDRINRDNKVQAEYGRMIATNPCGEQPLLGNESCNLGSINLAKFYTIPTDTRTNTPEWRELVDWDLLKETIGLAVRFLDNVIDANYYATTDIERMTKATRKIGLGVMGFADLLIQLKIGYNTQEGRAVGAEIMRFTEQEADKASTELAIERGSFPAWEKSEFTLPMRNACRLTVAPTGTISMLADTSSGIEPTFALAWKKHNVLEGESFYYVNKYFEDTAKDFDFLSDDLMSYISEGGSIQSREDIPQWVKDVYVTSADINGGDHVSMQAAFQKYCDSGISKTINFPNEASHAQVAAAYLEAWRQDCKGITVYRSGSRDKEVLVAATQEITTVDISDLVVKDFDENGKEITANQIPMISKGDDNEAKLAPLYIEMPSELNWVQMSSTPSESCPDCGAAPLAFESGCESCKSCGWSACHIS